MYFLDSTQSDLSRQAPKTDVRVEVFTVTKTTYEKTSNKKKQTQDTRKKKH